MTPRPDVLVAGDGQAAAFRGPDGRLAVLHSGRDSFAVKEWLAADADARLPKDPSLTNGVNCDAIGCVGKLGDGRLVSMALAVEAFAEDCTRAAVVVSVRETPSPDCVATLSTAMFGEAMARWRCVGRATDSSKPSRCRQAMTAHGDAVPWARLRAYRRRHLQRQAMRHRTRKT